MTAAPAIALEFARQGSGPPLVLVHGYLGGSRMWRETLDHFASRYDVIAPDLAGFGNSARLESPDRIEDHAEQVLAVLDRLGIKQFRLIGHSMGGMIAQHMAASVGERIDRMVLYGTGPYGHTRTRFETADMTRQRLLTEGVSATARHIAATWFVAGKDAPAYETCVEIGSRASLQGAIAGTHAFARWDAHAVLSTLAMPTLIVWGEKDRSIGWDQCEMLWRGIPRSSLAVCPGCAHNVHFEKPELFKLLVTDFLDACT
jgi:pimeloyl-ACP methyl ester carboxylesterase